MNAYFRSPRTRRRAYSLLEMVMASSLMALILVPSMNLLRDSVLLSEKMEKMELASTFCVSKMEEHLALAASSFTSNTFSGTFSENTSFRFSVVRSDVAGNGGISGRLMAITVTVWCDDNANAALDAGEVSTVFATKVAKMAQYPTGS